MSRYLKAPVAAALACALTASAFTPSVGALASAVSSDVNVGNPLALTFYLPLRDESGAEAAAQAIQTPGSSRYKRFLSVAQFVNDYGPTGAQINKLAAALAALGFKIQYVYPNHLAVEAISTAGNAESVLGLTLKNVIVNGKSGMRSTTPLRIPPALAGLISGVGGFDTVHRARPHVISTTIGQRPRPRVVSGNLVGGTPGNYLPADFKKFYNVDPIAKRGITGRGRTIGIVTLATFKPADAYAFWKQIGLDVSQSRITKVSVDNGDNALNFNGNGELETDLDVEQSGSIAPGANIRVYIAPNITASWINAFESAASENIADTLSSSWGSPELFYFDQLNKNTGSSSDKFELGVFHDVFLELALQGQSVFLSSGDSGSFDTVEGFPVFGTPSTSNPIFNAPYAVDHPASDPLVTAAGGTTLPFYETFTNPTFTFHLSVAHEQAWSWRYLADELAAQGLGDVFPVSDFFSTGDGGGVSSYWPLPWYQRFTKGITKTKPGQTLTIDIGAGPRLLQTLPAYYAGRNLPDISANADPYSGYQVLTEGQVEGGWGGTSFVAPQLNGVDALFAQALGRRVGQLNPAVYQLGNAVTTDVTFGDNWGYPAAGGYDNATGYGVLNASRLLIGLFALEYGPSSAAAVQARQLFEVR